MKGLDILMIEDSEPDVILISDVLETSGILNSLRVANNGREAMIVLKNAVETDVPTLPDLILMDINMPVMDGHETLELIKKDEKLKHIPVIMLTTSSSPSDVEKAYKNHSNSYIIKPYDITDLNHIVDTLKSYWVNVVRLAK